MEDRDDHFWSCLILAIILGPFTLPLILLKVYYSFTKPKNKTTIEKQALPIEKTKIHNKMPIYELPVGLTKKDLIKEKRLSLDRNTIARELMKTDDENPVDDFYDDLPALIVKERNKRLDELAQEKAERIQNQDVWIEATCDLMSKYPNVDVDELHGEEYKDELMNRIDEIIKNINEEYKKIIEEEDDSGIDKNNVKDVLSNSISI